MTGPNTPTGRCPWCNVAIYNNAATCIPCRKLERIDQPSDEHALTGGAWRYDPARRVQVWVPGVAA